MNGLQTNPWGGSLLVLLGLLPFAPQARAATPTEGAILGQVFDLDSGQPVPGVTVVASGPEGDVATSTSSRGNYEFRALPIGLYAIRFHRNEVQAEREATVSVDKTVRVNMRMPAVPAEVETIAAPYTAPTIDVGSSRIGTTFAGDFIDSIPERGADVASLIQKTPGGYQDDVGLSLSGGTGAENAYYLEGLNVTALRDGLLGTNLKLTFLEEAEVMSAGFGAEYGRAMGGVVNMALKSGTNEWKGSAFSWVEPGRLAGKPQRILDSSTVVTGTVEPNYTTDFGVELGGPILKDKLFLWLGYVPEVSRSYFVRYVDRFVDLNPDGSLIVDPIYSTRVAQEATTHNYAGKLTWRLRPDHVLSLSLVGIRKDETYLRGANMDLMAGMSHDFTSRQDIVAHWQSAFFNRHWRMDASLGLHTEANSNHSPYPAMGNLDRVTWYNTPSLGQFDAQAAPYCSNAGTGLQNCPVQGYQSGGYWPTFERSAFRLAGQIKSTNIFSGFGLHELKYGIDYEFNQYDEKTQMSGPDGSRGDVRVTSAGGLEVDTLYRSPNGYQDSIDSTTRAFNSGAFIQESYMPLPNLTFNVGVRWEAQRITDYRGNTALSIANSFAPRIGAIYDPTGEGRAKIFAHYGQYYESIPMDLAVRAFGGEGILTTQYPATCPAQSWKTCTATQSLLTANDHLAVQSNIKGSYNNEIVAGGQYQPWRDLVLGASVVRRWLGRIIEDTGGSIAEGTGAVVLSNITDPTFPKPERTYTALQLTGTKRLVKSWFMAGSYTLSRTQGNYTGLYDADAPQLDPNNSSQFDIRELMVNHNGLLPNDRPHIVHVDSYYRFILGRHSLLPGISFKGQSGQPITPLGAAANYGSDSVFILPRGSAGRTPFVTQFDVHLSYRTKISKTLSAEAFLDIFNVLNQRAALSVDTTYTQDQVMPANAGTPLGQVQSINNDGSATGNLAVKNPNYLRPTSYQAPITGRLGARIWF